jgi:Dimerisation domain
MAQPVGGIGNVAPSVGLVEMAMAYSRSRVICAAARLGVADALGDQVRGVDQLAEACQADGDALYRLLRALAAIGVTEETTPRHFRLTAFGRPLRRDGPSRHGRPSSSGRICLPTNGPCLPIASERASLPERCVIRMCLPAGRRNLKLPRSSVPSWARLPRKTTLPSRVPGTFHARMWSPILAGAAAH